MKRIVYLMSGRNKIGRNIKCYSQYNVKVDLSGNGFETEYLYKTFIGCAVTEHYNKVAEFVF